MSFVIITMWSINVYFLVLGLFSVRFIIHVKIDLYTSNNINLNTHTHTYIY